MFELLPKIAGSLKTIIFPIFMMSISLFSANKPKMKENSGMVDDDVLGDNFPYAVMRGGLF